MLNTLWKFGFNMYYYYNLFYNAIMFRYRQYTIPNAIKLNNTILVSYNFEGQRYQTLLPYNLNKTITGAVVYGVVGDTARQFNFQPGVPITVTPFEAGFDKFVIKSNITDIETTDAPGYPTFEILDED